MDDRKGILSSTVLTGLFGDPAKPRVSPEKLEYSIQMICTSLSQMSCTMLYIVAKGVQYGRTGDSQTTFTMGHFLLLKPKSITLV